MNMSNDFTSFLKYFDRSKEKLLKCEQQLDAQSKVCCNFRVISRMADYTYLFSSS